MRYLLTLLTLFSACFLSAQCDDPGDCASIEGFCWLDANDNGIQDAGEAGIEGITIQLLRPDFSVVASVPTDASGTFLMANIPPNTDYRLHYLRGDSQLYPAVTDLGGDDLSDNDFDQNSLQTTFFDLVAGQLETNIDLGLNGQDCTRGIGGDCGSITGLSWLDENFNGLRDADETTVVEATVTLFFPEGSSRVTTVAADGTYSFPEVPTLNYMLVVEPVDDRFAPTLFDVVPENDTDSDFDQFRLRSDWFDLAEGQDLTGLDVGWVDISGTGVEVKVWLDLDNDGIREPDAEYDVTTSVRLLAGPDQLLVEISGSSPSDSTVSFENLIPGVTYTLLFDNAEADLVPTLSNQGTDDEVDSDFDFASWQTPSFVLQPEEVVTDIGLGLNFLTCTGFPLSNFEEDIYLGCGGESVTITTLPDGTDNEYTYVLFQDDVFLSNALFLGVTIPAGDYTVFASYGDCEWTEDFSVISSDIPEVNLILDDFDFPFCPGTYCLRLDGLANGAGQVLDISWDGPPEFDATNPNEDEPTGICTDFPGLYTVTITSPCDSVATYTYEVPDHECNTISGTVFIDYDEDCVYQTGDLGAANYLVTLANDADGSTYTAYADAEGLWSISIPFGTYSITTIVPDGLPLLSCDPTTVTLGTDLVDEVYLGVRVLNDCAALRTEVTIPFLRRCFASSAFVAYHNAGTTLAPDATVTVDIDPFWIDVTTSVTPTSVDGMTYTFSVGDLGPFASGTIFFDFTVSCEAELGQAHCLEANISPQDFCNADDAWAGALVEIVDVVCDGDSIRFQIVNTGDNIMSVPLNYVVVEDGIMLSANPFVNGLLEADEAYEVSVAADGRTVSLSTNQEPFAPGTASPTVVLEGCNGAPNFSIGFTNLLPLNSGSPGSSLVCRENVGSYDPNDKMGYPLGWGGGNIEAGTRLDYEIRFQNTGTDTAFTVVIRDTLSAALDLSTFRMEAATHDYTVTIDTHRVITWAFNNIMLVDSFTNVPGSQGSVVFSIDHAEELQPGDEILNEAAIYFDFNEPVITNVSRHVIAAEGLPTSVRRVLARSVPLRVFPNPAGDRIRLLVNETDVANTDLVSVMDLLGRPLISLPATQAGGGVDVRALPPGYYVLVLTDALGRAKGRTNFMVTSR